MHVTMQHPQPVDTTWRMSFTPAPQSVRLARSQARHALAACGAGDAIADTAVLVISELVTNSIRHVDAARHLVEVAIISRGSDVMVEVSDPSPRQPVMPVTQPDAEPDREDGRGLFLVGALADTWGVRGDGGAGKTVWAVISPTAAVPVAEERPC